MEPWRAKLDEGDHDAAWRLFIGRYERLMAAVVRRTIVDEDAAADAFEYVCEKLADDGFARLRRYDDGSTKARFSTWLVVVVHNMAIDWTRKQDGRRRIRVPSGLSPLQQQIFRRVFIEHWSHVEAYELVCAASERALTYGSFLKELRATYAVVEHTHPAGAVRYLSPVPVEAEEPLRTSDDAVSREEVLRRVGEALAALPDEERVGVQLFIVEKMPAADVARMLGWPNAKTVYNRVYRALARMRQSFETEGISRSDF